MKMGFLDTPLSVAYATVIEEAAGAAASSSATKQQQLLQQQHQSNSTSTSLSASPNNDNNNHNHLSAEALSLEQCRHLAECLDLGATAGKEGQPPLSGRNIMKVLVALAEVRALLARLAKIVASQETLSSLEEEETAAALTADLACIEPLMAKRDGHEMFRSVRMFFLKQLERGHGVSLVRSVFQRPPVRELAWVESWKTQEADVAFLRFVGQNALPRLNPLAGLPGFQEMRGLIAAALVSGSVDEFNAGLSKLVDAMGGPVLRPALAAALFYEVKLLEVLPSTKGSVTSQHARALVAWLETAPEALRRCFPDEADLPVLLALAGGGGGESQKSAQHSDLLRLDPTSSPEALLRMQLMVHLAVAALACGSDNTAAPDSPLALFHTLLVAPERLKDSWLPCMPEDVLKMAQDVMGGRWYMCPNKHPFYVDLCGRPTVIQTCAECGAEIGGTDHNLIGDNVDMGDVGTELYQKTVLEDTSERHYCLGPASAEHKDRFKAVRALNPTSYRALQFFLHSIMLTGLGASDAWQARASHIINEDFAQTGGEGGIRPFLEAHCDANWRALKELMDKNGDDLALLLHLVLLSAGPAAEPAAYHPDPQLLANLTPPPQQQQQQQQLAAAEERMPTNNASGNTGGGETFALLETPGKRGALEKVLDVAHTSRILLGTAPDVAKLVAAAEVKFNTAEEEGGVLVAELYENFDPDALRPQERQRSALNLWRYRRPFSLAHFTTVLKLSGGNGKGNDTVVEYPALSHFLDHEPALRALRYIPLALGWIRLLMRKFNRHLDRDRAREVTIRETLAEVPPAERDHWLEAFNGFAAAWNLNWPRITMFNCLPLPDMYRNVQMGLDTQLSFCLPCEQDEGVCPLALLQHLATTHNNLVFSVDERMLTNSSSKETHAASMSRLVSSRHMTMAHALRYDVERDLIPFFEKQCVTQSGYDFFKAESRLLTHHLARIPKIDLEIRVFTFAHEQHLRGGLAPLKTKVLQSPLPKETIDHIRRDLASPARASTILEVLETAVAFLTATGGSFVHQLDTSVGEITLAQYVAKVLLMERATEDLGHAISASVQLKHLEALWNVLTELTKIDPFAAVSPKYKVDLSEDNAVQLRRYLDKLDEAKVATLRDHLKTLVTTYFVEESMSPTASLSVALGTFEVDDEYLMDVSWFQAFPSSISNESAVETLKQLS
uniref:RZ-type domain-containing protein n=1 Tax=Octactis speculum TaxID=3111310 RepID=A0A7S2DCV1_9STRA